MTGLIVLMGPPAAGKTTYATELETDGWQVVSPDAIREAAGAAPGEDNLATFIAAYQHTQRLLNQGKRVVFDSTALTENVRRRLRQSAKMRRLPVHLAVVHADRRVCLARNRRRRHSVPDDKMRQMLDTYERQYPIAIGERWTTTTVIDGRRIAAQMAPAS
jgi:predicted kinase